MGTEFDSRIEMHFPMWIFMKIMKNKLKQCRFYSCLIYPQEARKFSLLCECLYWSSLLWGCSLRQSTKSTHGGGIPKWFSQNPPAPAVSGSSNPLWKSSLITSPHWSLLSAFLCSSIAGDVYHNAGCCSSRHMLLPVLLHSEYRSKKASGLATMAAGGALAGPYYLRQTSNSSS